MKRKTLEKGTKRKHKKNDENKELMGTCNSSPQKVGAAAAAVSPPPPPFHPPLSSLVSPRRKHRVCIVMTESERNTVSMPCLARAPPPPPAPPACGT